MRLIVIAAIAIFAWKLLLGTWPWQRRPSARERALAQARSLLAVQRGAKRNDILAAHRRLVTQVHPDRGGSSAQIYEADAARDLLLRELPAEPEEIA